MMVGRVTGTPEAIVPLVIAGPAGNQAKIDAVLDTGFTDFLTLPPATIAALGLTAMDTIECQLADGHRQHAKLPRVR
jgi:predicted aspartyl protease